MKENGKLNAENGTKLADTVEDELDNGDKYVRPLMGPFMAYKHQSESSMKFIQKYFEFFHVDDYMQNQTQIIYENYTSIEHTENSERKRIELSHQHNVITL